MAARLRDILFKWGLPPACPLSETSAFEAVVGIPFGTHVPPQPVAAVNKCLASIIDQAVGGKSQKIAVVQWEIATVEGMDFTRVVVGNPGDYHINTREFFLQVREFLPGVKKLLVVAQTDHLWRCRWVAEKLGYQVVTPRVFPLVDPSSRQWWARGRVRFLLWELGARIYFRWKGWI